MAFAEKSSDGVFNGTTAVDVCPFPGSGHTFIIRSVTLHNADTVACTATLNYYSGGNLRTLMKVQLDAGATMVYEVVQACDAMTKKLQGVLLSAHTTTAPTFVTTYADVS